MSVQGSMLSCLLFTTMFEHVLLLPLILIIFSKPPSAELCKHTHGCQLSLESDQTILSSPATMREIFPGGATWPDHEAELILKSDICKVWRLVWWRHAILTVSMERRGEERRRGTQSKCYCYCAGRLLYQLSNYILFTDYKTKETKLVSTYNMLYCRLQRWMLNIKLY